MRPRTPAPLPGTADLSSPPRRRGRAGILVTVAAVAGLLVGATGTGWASHTFSDVPTSHPFHSQITWLSNVGVTGGFGDGTYRPNSAVTRGSMAAFMQRLHNLRDTVAVQAGNFAIIDTPDGTWVDVDGVSGPGTMSATVTVPPGTTATLVARYGAETLCADSDGSGYCAIRLMRGTTEMNVGHNTALVIDSASSSAATTDGSEAHLIERWLTNVPAGNHTVRVQATEGAGGVLSYSLDNQTLVVEVILNKA